MLDKSVLAKDRRKETWLLAIVSLFLCAELVVLPHVHVSVIELLALGHLAFGLAVACGLVVWNLVRLVRLRRKRSSLFSFGLALWLLLFMASVLAQFSPYRVVLGSLELHWPLVFLGGNMLLSFFARLKRSKFVHELGWPVLKDIHWMYGVVIIGFYCFGLLSQSQVFVFSVIGVFLLSRYAFNRWIYGVRVHYPYKPTAAKFFIKQLRSYE